MADALSPVALHEVAFVDKAKTCASVDGTRDVRVGEDGLKIVDGGLIGACLCFLLLDEGARRVDLLLGDSERSNLFVAPRSRLVFASWLRSAPFLRGLGRAGLDK